MQARAQKSGSWDHSIVTHIEQKVAFMLGLFWETIFQRNYCILVENCLQNGTQIGAEVGLGRSITQLFSPLGRQGCPSGAQWRPKWAQGSPKAAKMERKCCPRSSKGGFKTSGKKISSNESVSVREQGRGRGRSRRKGRGHATANRDIETNFYPSPNGGPSSKVYIYIYINS